MPKSKRRKRSKSKSGYIGSYKNNNGDKYTSTIKIDGKNKYLGSSFDTAKQAAKAYDNEAIKLRRPLSKLNYPKKAPVGYTPTQQALQSNNTVGYRGVYKEKNGKSKAGITIDGKHTHIGTFDTPKEAAVAYDRAVLKANRSTSHLNFPGMVHNLDVEPERKRKYKKNVAKKKKTGNKGGAKGTSKTETGTFQALDALAALAASKKGKGSKFPTVKD